MIKRIKSYLKSMNPYLVASAIMVVLSVCMIFVILHKGNSSEDEAAWETDTVIMEESWELPEELPGTSDEAWEEQRTEVEIEFTTIETKSATAEMELTTDEIDPEAEQEIEAEFEKESEERQKEPSETETVSEEETVVPEKESESDSLPEDAECTHSWMFESYYQEPDCSNGGLENQICIHCGETQTTIGTPTGKHVYVTETPGDCCSEEVVVCTECNHREVREKDPGNHMDVEEGFCYGCGQEAK